MQNLFNEKKDILSVIIDVYNLMEYKSSDKSSYRTSQEWFKTIGLSDNCELFYSLLRLMMISLITPESISAALKDKTDASDYMEKYEKIKVKDFKKLIEIVRIC